MTTSDGAGDKLVRHSILLMASAQAANLANIVFHMVAGRAFPPAEYGVLAAMLNMMLVIATPLDALRNAMAHSSGHAVRTGRRDVLRAIAIRWSGKVALPAAAGAILLLVFEHAVAGFLHLENPVPIRVLAASLPFLVLLPVLTGVLQGTQSFVWFAGSLHGWNVLRTVLVFAAVFLGFRSATGGVSAHGAALLCGCAIALFGVWRMTAGAPRGVDAPTGIGAYFVRALLMLAAFGFLMNLDVILMRHFHPHAAGSYAWAATIGRAVVFLPMPIALAMFPKVISGGGMTPEARVTLLKAVGMAVGLVALGVLATWLLPWLGLRILYNIKAPSPDLLRLVQFTTLAMSPLAIAYVLLNFEMAQHRFKTLPWLAGCVAIYVGGVALFHPSTLHVVAWMGAGGFCAMIVLAAAIVAAERRR